MHLVPLLVDYIARNLML